ncbi:MAG: hypothetical protein KC493_07880 [Bacteriovoracaceae bacterium]|nr:hypothetical protein [Bacteriovoracaceae bacterium]
MKLILAMLVAGLLVSCSTFNKFSPRYPASYGKDLSGSYLGVADYKFGHRGPNNAATRLYLHEIEGEQGSYYALIHEYVNLLNMMPEYVAASKAPALNKIIGYLKKITKKLEVYKMVPTKNIGEFHFYPVKVEGEKIVSIKIEKPRKLILKKENGSESPLIGAVITSNGKKKQPKEIFFPMEKDKKYNGIQYTLANFVYKKIGLDSTWRKEFLPGPYLSAYGRLDDVVLDLKSDKSQHFGNFKLNPKMAKKSKRRRRRMFTNKKSAFLNGKFEAIEPQDGMFLFRPVEADKGTISVLSGRIGLFVDIFDATEVLNQDVVELILVDPAKPEDFLMYYEHPENGEGQTAE